MDTMKTMRHRVRPRRDDRGERVARRAFALPHVLQDSDFEQEPVE